VHEYIQCARPWVLALLLISLVSACNQNDPRLGEAPLQPDRLLTLEDLFNDKLYEPEEPGRIRWLDDGSGYTTLETAAAYEDAEPEEDEDGEEVKAPQDIVFYDPETLDRSVMVSELQLTPEGADRALIIDDYHWSDDRAQLLVYTNSKKVWRTNSRGDYWVLDIARDELWQLGGNEAEASTLMFAKFSPDATRVAFVRDDNIYVQDLDSGMIEQLTTDASDTVINGLFDWAYEEEFQIKDGFRWSPDGQSIAYWQLDTSAAQDFLLINNTDTLYPTISRFPYPKVGEENSAARVGVISLASKKTVWAKLPGVAKDMYIPRMDWAKNSEQIIVQHMNRKQDTNDVYYADATTGELTTALIEKEQAFIEDVIDVTWFNDEDAFAWISERSGWRHIYRVSRDGRSLVDLTPGDFDIIQMGAMDEESGWLFFIASPDAMEQRFLYRTRLDGSGEMTRVTPDEYAGTNSYQISQDGHWAIHTHSSFSQPPQYRLVSLPDHKVRHVLENNQELIDLMANITLGDHEFFQVEAQDGLMLDGFIMRPPDFDPAKKYPMINYVYGEPAGQTVRDRWYGARHMWHMLLTQKGFIVA
jgi:dipeptidyl-peptidase-4